MKASPSLITSHFGRIWAEDEEYSKKCASFQRSSTKPGRRSCEEIPERAKVPRAETQRRGVDKENRAFIYFKPLRLCVSARDCKFFLTFPVP